MNLDKTEETRDLALALIEERLAALSIRIFNVRRAGEITDDEGHHPYLECALLREEILQDRANFLLERWSRVRDSSPSSKE